MGTLATRNLSDDGLSSTAVTLLSKITAKTIWADARIDYFFGGSTALNLDDEFDAAFSDAVGGSSRPDASFAFSTLANRAFAMIDAVVAIDFHHTTSTASADLVLVSTNDAPDADLEGFFYFPGDMDKDGTSQSWSLGAFNSGVDYMLQAAERGGGQYANWTIIHEIGHSLGLKHTHSESTGQPLAVVGQYMDNEKYSVMSYNDASDGNAYGHAVSMMALDVASLQALYGKETYAAGNSSYSLMNAKGAALDLSEGDVAIGRAYYCIWDSGGKDKIDYAGSGKAVLINLNAATLNTSSDSSNLKALISDLKDTSFYAKLDSDLQQEIVDRWHHAGGFFSHVLSASSGSYAAIDGGFSIAHGATIENAVGGDKGDLLIGNAADNILTGNAGADTLLGGAGSDTLKGGSGADRLNGGRGSDILVGASGDDVFVFETGSGSDWIVDFTDGDIIDLTGLSGISSYADLKANDMAAVSGDVEVTVGSDVLTIMDTTLAQLHSSDFRL